MKVLHCFGTKPGGSHGLGDCIMFTSVLKHLKEQRPKWRNFIACGPGRQSIFKDLCEESYLLGKQPSEREFDQIVWHPWNETWTVYHDWPSTKTTKCIAEQFHLICNWDLLRYQINVGDKAKELAEQYIKTLPKNKGFVLIHYQGNTSSDSKNIAQTEIFKVCSWLIKYEFSPVILDWDFRSKLPDQKTIFCPNVTNSLWESLGTGDAEKIAALMQKSALNICIDSGPGKIAMAVDTPCIKVWTKHHPIHFADNSLHNTIHLIPQNHADFMRGDKDKGQVVFDKFYKYAKYNAQNMIGDAIIASAAQILKLDTMSVGILTSRSFDKDYYQQHQVAGLDYLNYGKWQKDYGKWLVDSLKMHGKTVLDVGCACGSIAAGLAEAGAFVSGCDLSQYMIELGRVKWPNFPIFVCDAVNLHLWGDQTFDFIHSAQVFEHFKPELVPFILKEIHRVTKPNGVMFAVFDTVELFAKQNRVLENEDPTHVCVKPIDWWHTKLKGSGWTIAPNVFNIVKNHPNSYFKEYAWDGICCVKN